MEEEDSALYDSPPPWKSSSKVVRTFIKPIGMVLLAIGIVVLVTGVLLLLVDYGVLCLGFFLLAAPFFLVFGVVLLIISHKSATDRKDTWAIRLPYSRELFRRITWDVEQYLRNSGFRYAPGPNHYYYVGRVKGQRNFTIYLPSKPNLIIRMALVYDHDPEHVSSYDFFLNLANITMDNMKEAKNVAKQIYNVLHHHRYWLWKDDYGYSL